MPHSSCVAVSLHEAAHELCLACREVLVTPFPPSAQLLSMRMPVVSSGEQQAQQRSSAAGLPTAGEKAGMGGGHHHLPVIAEPAAPVEDLIVYLVYRVDFSPLGLCPWRILRGEA